MMFMNRTIDKMIEEVVANGIGWISGLLSIDVLDFFFIQKSWKNAWGIFSKRTVVDAETYSFLEWVLTAAIGLAVMLLVNRLVRDKLLGKIFKKDASQNLETSTSETPSDKDSTITSK